MRDNIQNEIACEKCQYLIWFGDYALHYCDITGKVKETKDICDLSHKDYTKGERFMNTIRYYIFALHWICKHRYWKSSRQKWKAMDKEWERRELHRRNK